MKMKRTARWISILSLMGFTHAFAQDADTLAAISAAMDNPVGELIILQNQIDYYFIDMPGIGHKDEAFSYKLIPTFPISISENWNLVNRFIFQYNSVPVNKEAGDLIGFSLDQVVGDSQAMQKLQNIAEDPFDKTYGFGDTTYLGLFAPKEPIKTENGTFLWGAGPALMFSTAEQEVLGVGANSAGVGALAAYITSKWRFGVLPMQFWSYQEDSGRDNFNYMNMQYFAFYAPDPTLSIGMSPNMTVNWNADSGDQVTLPAGLGFNKTLFIGPLPVRIGAEVHYNVIQPSDVAHSEWSMRVFAVPVMPAPGSNLAKALAKSK